MYVRAMALILGALAVLGSVACGGSRSYSSNKEDDRYDLAAMRLTEADLPAGLTELEIEDHEFDNEAWVSLLENNGNLPEDADVEATQKQFDAQGRLRGYVAVFQPEKLGRVLGVTSISTLYTDPAAANEAQHKYGCGVLIGDRDQTNDFLVPKIADGATGFYVEQPNGLVEATLCFRTGRLLHAVQQSNVPGTTDIALQVRLAQKMLGHVNDTFDGKAGPAGGTASTPNP